MVEKCKPLAIATLALAVLVAVGTPHAAGAAAKATPSASADATANPSASPTSSPEPLDKQIPRLETKLKIDPNDKDSLTQLSADYLTINRPDLAQPLTQRLLATGNKTSQVYYLDGYVNLQQGRTQQAMADMEQASNLDPTNNGVLGLLTELYLQAGRTQDAERVAKRALAFNKDDKGAMENYGIVLGTEKKYDDARAQFEAAAKADPKDPQPLILEARSYVDQGATALAIGSYDRAIAVDPKNVEAILGEARLYGDQHDVKDGIATYGRALAIVTDPNQKAAIVAEEAHLYATEKDDTDADALYKKNIADNPTIGGAHVAYGDYLAFKKQMPQAEAEWIAALGPNRDNRDALQRLGEYYASTNQTQKAIDQFKRLTEVTPGDAASWAQLGQLYGITKQYDKAHDAYRTAYEISRSPQALIGMASSDYELHRWAEASAIFDALDKGAPDVLKASPQLYFVMGQVYQGSNQPGKAKLAYQRFLPFLKPNSQGATQVKKLIAELDKKPSAKATSAPKKS